MYDTNKDLDHRHCHNGGTHITNFDNNALLVYSEAIEEFNKVNKTNLIVSAYAYDFQGKLLPSYCSLHAPKGCGDLSDFWKIYDKLKESV